MITLGELAQESPCNGAETAKTRNHRKTRRAHKRSVGSGRTHGRRALRLLRCATPTRSMHARSRRNCGPANPLQITNHTTMAGGGAASGKPQGSARSGRSVLAHPGNEASGQKNDPSGHLPTFCCNCTHTVHGRSLLRSQHCSNRLLDHLRHIIS